MESPAEPVRTVSVWSRDRLFVDVHAYADGRVVIEGQDLRGDDELEYYFTIPGEAVPALVSALGGAPGADPLTLLREQAGPVVLGGELHWLRAHGVPFELRTW